MVKIVFIAHKRSDMDQEEFRRYWRETHAPIAAKIPGVRKYIQNYANIGFDGTPPPFDGFVEFWFDDEASLERSIESPEGEAALADLRNFLDIERLQSFSVEEVTII